MKVRKDAVLFVRFNPAPMYRAMARLGAELALLVVTDPRRRWKLKHRIARIDRRAGRTRPASGGKERRPGGPTKTSAR